MLATFRRNPRNAFTVIELMIVILIIGVITSLSVGVYIAQTARAKNAATIALIKILNDSLQDRLESFYNSTRQSVPNSTSNRYTVIATFAGNVEIPSILTKRAQLLARLDLMRGEFPQQFIDFMRSPYAACPTGDADPTNTFVGLGDGTFISAGRSAIFQEYLRRTLRPGGAPQLGGVPPAYAPGTSYTPVPFQHQPETESSECLYLMLTAATAEGTTFDVTKIDPSLIKDTDQDGLKEFVDAWGKPLRFYRWPTDYVRYIADVNGQLPTSLFRNTAVVGDPPAAADRPRFWRNTVDPDYLLIRQLWWNNRRNDFERTFNIAPANVFGAYFRLHDLYTNSHIAPPAAVPFNLTVDESNPAAPVPWTYPLIPLIVSAGPDGEFGLTWRQDGSAPRFNDLDIRCARVGGTITGAGAFQVQGNLVGNVNDNITSILLRAGTESGGS